MNVELMQMYGDKEVRKSLDGLSHSDWATGGVCGVWSVKDIIGHLGVQELVMAEILQGFLGGGETPLLQKMGEIGPLAFNDYQADLRKNNSVQEVLDEYDGAFAKVTELIPQIPAETWRQAGLIPWYGEEYALDDLFVYSVYAHKREHSAQINVFRDSLK